MIAVALLIAASLLILVALSSCSRRGSDPEAFADPRPVLELHVHQSCTERCKRFIEDVWAPAQVWMAGPAGLGLPMVTIDDTGAPGMVDAGRAMSRMDIATRDIVRAPVTAVAAPFPYARLVYPDERRPIVYNGPAQWLPFRDWLSTVMRP